MIQTLRACLLLLLGLTSATRAEETTLPKPEVNPAVALLPFEQGEWPGEPLTSLIRADLARSGRLATLPEQSLPEHPSFDSQPQFPAWQAAGATHLLVGRIRSEGGPFYQAEITLFATQGGQPILAERLLFDADEFRHTAHRITDLVYEKITGQRGIFNTRIAYVAVSGQQAQRQYQLLISDLDGLGKRHPVITSSEPILSPAWSPDGQRLAYISFEAGRATLFIQHLATGRRRQIPEAQGSQSAPSWSPDGSELALTLSRDGNPEIALFKPLLETLRLVTENGAIDTEARWSPDGRHLAFTSNRGGKPQLYLMPAKGGEARRLTFEGDYNSRATFSPDGHQLALVHATAEGDQIATMNLDTQTLKVLTPGPLDDSPDFSPNGEWILYTHLNKAGSNALMAISTDGSRRFVIDTKGLSVRGAAWSP